MDVNDLKGLFAEVNKRMDVALEHVKHELAGVRTGRASTALLDHVQVEAYGTKMPLNQVAGLSVPEPTLDRRYSPSTPRCSPRSSVRSESPISA